MSTLQVNDRVMYSAKFVRACGYSKALADQRGTIRTLTPLAGTAFLAEVEWQSPSGSEHKKVMASNLARADQPELD